jgi:PIN domain nuclease of toxin-antitoxin system
MKVLLDSHALLWYVLGDPKLSATAEQAILDPANEVVSSPASYWEIAIKVSIGKYSLNRPFSEFVDLCVNRYRFGLLPIEPKHAAEVAVLPFPANHKDPFDRLLIAQAIVESIPIVGNDVAFDDYPVKRIW